MIPLHEQQTIYDLHTKHGKPYSEIADMFKLTRGQVAGIILRQKNKPVWKAPQAETPMPEPDDTNFRASVSHHDNGYITSERLINLDADEAKTPDKVLLAHGFKPDDWVIVTAVNNYWQGIKSWRFGDGVRTLYQSKITVRPRVDTDITFADVDKWMTNKKGTAKPIKPAQYRKGGKVLEVNIADMHINKEGNENIGNDLEKTLADILRRASSLSFEYIILIVGNDLFHSDTYGRTTTAGTPVGGAQSFAPMFDTGMDYLTRMVDTLRSIAPIEVVWIPGNHDHITSYMAVKTLEAWYRNVKGVTVDTGHSSRKFREIGTSLVGWTHGDMAKNKIGKWLHVEAREAWGRTRFAEIHAGHLHSEQAVEDNGVIVRHLPTMTTTDDWHYEKGYVGNARRTVSFVWDLRDGLLEQWYTNV